jgi:hypothetical protein
VIRFSAALVAVAIGVLIGGIATSKLLLVYIAIAVSAVALVALVTGVVLKREELFGEEQGLVPAAAGTSPGLPVHAGDSQGTVPSSGYVAPPPPAAGAAAGYGVPFGGVAQATSSPGVDLTATRQGAARHGRPAEPVPPWDAAATRASWTPDWMPAATDQRAASGADVRAPSAWQDTATVTAAGNWGTPGADAPTAGAPDADASNANTRAAAAPPRAWAAPPTMPTPVPSDAPAAKPDAGSEETTPSWFDRLGQSAGTDTPTAPSAPVPSAPVPGSGSGWSWSNRDTGTPGGPVAHEEPLAPATGSGDEDDDWPTRYSWLDDEPDQSDDSDESVVTATAGKDDQGGDKRGKASAKAEATVAATVVGPAAKSESPAAPSAEARDAEAATKETAAQATPDEKPAGEAPKDSAADKPADTAGKTGATVLAFRSRKEPEPEPAPEAPTPASDADHEAGPNGKTGETAAAEADLDAAPAPDTEAAAGAEDEPAAAPAPDGAALVAVVRGVPRYHKPDCVLIRFMPEGDLQKLTVPQAKEDGCTPCTACQPAE